MAAIGGGSSSRRSPIGGAGAPEVRQARKVLGDSKDLMYAVSCVWNNFSQFKDLGNSYSDFEGHFCNVCNVDVVYFSHTSVNSAILGI